MLLNSVKGKMERKEILVVVLVVAGLVVAGGYIFSQMFNTPTISEVSHPDVGTASEGQPAAPATAPEANVSADTTTNESKAEIEKIDTDGDGMSDWFEENYTHTDPKVANDKYLIWIDAPLKKDFKADFRSSG